MGNEIAPGQRPQGSVQCVQLRRIHHHQQPGTLEIGLAQQPTSMVALVGGVEVKDDFVHSCLLLGAC